MERLSDLIDGKECIGAGGNGCVFGLSPDTALKVFMYDVDTVSEMEAVNDVLHGLDSHQTKLLYPTNIRPVTGPDAEFECPDTRTGLVLHADAVGRYGVHEMRRAKYDLESGLVQNDNKLAVCLNACEGLKILQTHQRIHLDVKGANIMVHGDTGKLIDFDTLTPFDDVMDHEHLHACTSYGIVPPEFMTMHMNWDAAKLGRCQVERMKGFGVHRVIELIMNKHAQSLKKVSSPFTPAHITPAEYAANKTQYAAAYDVYGMGITLCAYMPDACYRDPVFAEMVISMLAWHPKDRPAIDVVIHVMKIRRHRMYPTGGSSKSSGYKNTGRKVAIKGSAKPRTIYAKGDKLFVREMKARRDGKRVASYKPLLR